MTSYPKRIATRVSIHTTYGIYVNPVHKSSPRAKYAVPRGLLRTIPGFPQTRPHYLRVESRASLSASKYCLEGLPTHACQSSPSTYRRGLKRLCFYTCASQQPLPLWEHFIKRLTNPVLSISHADHCPPNTPPSSTKYLRMYSSRERNSAALVTSLSTPEQRTTPTVMREPGVGASLPSSNSVRFAEGTFTPPRKRRPRAN